MLTCASGNIRTCKKQPSGKLEEESWIPESEKFWSWIPESEKFCSWNPESGINNFAWGIQNRWLWNLESHQRLESGTQVLHQRLEFSAWNPKSMTWNLAPKTILDSLTFEWSTRIMTRGIFFGTSIAGFNFPLKTNALSWSQSICFSYFHPLSPLHHEVSCQSSMLSQC